MLLRAGALPAELTFLEERTIGPELGQDSIDAGQRRGGDRAWSRSWLFMIASYGLFGVFANIALAINMALIFGVLSMIGGTLTLPGIAGIVLTIGMAVDANVLVFERIREELRTQKGPARAIEIGYERAMSAIVDANLTTLITALVLFFIGSGPVRGFAVTLGIGIITSVFTALSGDAAHHRDLVRLAPSQDDRGLRRADMAWRLRLAPEKTNIDFFRWQWLTFGGSMALMVLAFAAWGVMGLNFGIDFKGGTTIRTESTHAGRCRRLSRRRWRRCRWAMSRSPRCSTRALPADQHVAMIRIAALDKTEAVTPETMQQVEAALTALDPAITFPSVESVGPKVSGELVWSSVLAVAVTSIGIMLYIWLRFEWQFAVGGVLALLHDVFITIGIFALFQLKFDLTIVAALLTILGYSINDTVVVFDRLRENLVKYKTMPLRDVMNLSVNETLSRTLMTSITTLIAVGSMLIFGGDVIRGFSFAIFMGVLLGTYSSVYVAKNIVLMIGLDRSEKPKNAARPERVRQYRRLSGGCACA